MRLGLTRKSRRQQTEARLQVRVEKGAQVDNLAAQQQWYQQNQKRARKLRVWAKEHGYRDRGIDEL